MATARTDVTYTGRQIAVAGALMLTILLGVPSLIAGGIGLLRSGDPPTDYGIKYAMPGDRYREENLYVNNLDGDRMVTVHRSWPRPHDEVTWYPRWLPVWPEPTKPREQTGGALGNFTEDEARRIFSISKASAKGNTWVKDDDKAQIKLVVDDIKRQHGEDPTWRPRPPWMWPAFSVFFVCLALFIVICIVDEIAYAVSRRLGKRTRT
ncbi:hypothetical protein ACFTSF_09340 [Kribbella sp. NPDC056951]|uniref:hypothetical protein n=1 Tax=Kribbella sp. NPDC056951 TaxID=3345978 RepID=UPI00363F06B5